MTSTQHKHQKGENNVTFLFLLLFKIFKGKKKQHN